MLHDINILSIHSHYLHETLPPKKGDLLTTLVNQRL